MPRLSKADQLKVIVKDARNAWIAGADHCGYRDPDYVAELVGKGFKVEWPFTPLSRQPGERVYLRIVCVGDGTFIETSTGYQRNVDYCKEIWKKIKAVKARGKAWRFTNLSWSKWPGLRSISATGTATVGCSRIQYSEMKRIAILLGVERR